LGRTFSCLKNRQGGKSLVKKERDKKPGRISDIRSRQKGGGNSKVRRVLHAIGEKSGSGQ